MLKKISIHNPSDSSCVQNKKSCCSICNTGKSIFYVCKSGRHVMCNNCQYNALNLESTKNTNDDGDYVPEKECAPTSKKEILFRHSGCNHRDMCSGDHSRIVELHKSITMNGLIKRDLLPTSTPKGCFKCEPETMVIYRNEKFHDGRSNITSDNYSPIKISEEQACESATRPVVCPIASCGKIVTIDSFSQHFDFDHSKVPKKLFNKSSPQEILLSYSSLSEETQCIATFWISHKKRSSHTALRRSTSHTNIHNFNKDCQLILLMAAKIKTTPLQFSIKKRNSRYSESNTLIDDIRRRNIQDNISSIDKSQSENKIHVDKCTKDDDEMLVIWLCRLNNKNRIYTINLSRQDNQQGYSYIGDAVHIRHGQDPISIYSSTECLSLRGASVKKLVTTGNELKVIVSTMQ